MKPIVLSLWCTFDVKPFLTLDNVGLIFIQNRKIGLSIVLCKGIFQYLLQIFNYFQPKSKRMFLVGLFSHIQQGPEQW